ncbi:MAG: c-type cytochrome biogenesis protein CcsB [bacterium]|nr:c-type cytochrome biogenesis protein CcsB [bacterium]
MSFLLFQTSLALYLLATAAYLVFFFSEKAQIRKNARLLFVLAFALHSVTIIVRYFEAGHTPITTRHETISFFAWSLGCGYLSFCWRYEVKNLGAFVSLLVLTLMTMAAFASREIVSLSPLLQSGWLPAHASLSILAYGFFALAGIGGLMYLLQERTIKRKRFGLFYSRLPSLETLDKLNHHCLSVGFPLLTLGMITGSLWAKQALGSYWHWDPKETWTLITWLLYAGLIHQRFTVGWRGRQAAWLSIAALVVALFTYWGVSVFFAGYHGNFS